MPAGPVSLSNLNPQRLTLEGGVTANAKVPYGYPSLGRRQRPKRVDGKILLWWLQVFREARQCNMLARGKAPVLR